jgi:hypothetical protein
MGLRTGLDDMEKRKFLPVLGHELRSLGRPACSQSLYRLSHPGSYKPRTRFNRNPCTSLGNESFGRKESPIAVLRISRAFCEAESMRNCTVFYLIFVCNDAFSTIVEIIQNNL